MREGRTHVGTELPKTAVDWANYEHAALIADASDTISRHHAAIEWHDTHAGEIQWRQFVTINPSKINNRAVLPGVPQPLRPGDEVSAGASVFRLCVENDLKWGWPRKSGVVWELIVLWLSVLLSLAGLWRVYEASRVMTLAGSRPPVVLTGQSDAGLAAPAADIGPLYNYAPALAWSPRQKCCVVASIDGTGTVTGTEGRTLKHLWTGQERATAEQGIAAADLYGGGSCAFIFSTATGRVVAVDPGTGIYLWESDFLDAGLLSPTVADLDGDGRLDVVVASSRGAVFVGHNLKTGLKFERLGYRGEEFDVPATVADCDGDGRQEIVLVESHGRTVVLDGVQGTPKVSTPYPSEAVARMDNAFPLTAEVFVHSLPSFVSTKGEKGLEMVTVLRNPPVVTLLHLPPGDVAWARNLHDVGRAGYVPGPLYAAPVSADLNGDGVSDVVVGLQSGPLVALDGKNGRPLWSYCEQNQWERIYASPALYDFDKDGTFDVVFGDDKGRVHIVSGRSGKSLAASGPGPGPILSPPMVGDLDGDTKMEVAVQCSDGTLMVFRTSSVTPVPGASWPMEGGRPDRTGMPDTPGFDAGAKTAELVEIGLLMSLLFGLNWFLRPRKGSVHRPENEIQHFNRP